MAESGLATVPPDTLLAEELADDLIADMANLTAAQTGVEGMIFISRAMRARLTRHIFFTARTSPAERFRVDCRRAGGGREQSARSGRPADGAARP
jgi:hypothetical protein